MVTVELHELGFPAPGGAKEAFTEESTHAGSILELMGVADPLASHLFRAAASHLCFTAFPPIEQGADEGGRRWQWAPCIIY